LKNSPSGIRAKPFYDENHFNERPTIRPDRP